MKNSVWLLGLIVVLSICIRNAVGQTADAPGLETDLKQGKVPLKTDDEVVQREEEALSADGYSIAEQKAMRKAAEKFTFQTEVNRLMQIIINSLYSNKEIFLREAISNASDALDKIRFLALTNPKLLGEGELPNLDIRIKADKERNILHIIDKGVGMTKQELINNLGTIAQSGTKEFMEKMQREQDSNLIGQFGVGFYSYFLVGKKIAVTTKSNDDSKQWIWESEAGQEYTITEDPHGPTLGRGTRVSIYLNDDAKYLLYGDTLEKLIQKYSEFINFPIYLWTERTEEEEVPAEPEEKKEEPKSDDKKVEVDEDDDDDDEKKAEEDKPKTKKITKKIAEWQQVNKTKPIWTRKPSDITQEEYYNFYKSFAKETTDPMTHTHFTGEGEVDFKSILYIPSTAPDGMFYMRTKVKGLKLYVKRVFITDELESLMPSYLVFIKGVVDSDDLPLNVSREILQQDKSLNAIKRKLVRKAIAMIQELAKDPAKYGTFWDQYSSNIKYGMLEDNDNKIRLSKLLRFHTSNGPEWTSLDDYVNRMKKGQEEIYYLAGESRESVEKSPIVERLIKRGYEVIFCEDPLDEYAMSGLEKYDSKYKLVNISKEGWKMPGEDAEEEKKLEEEFKPLVTFLKDRLAAKVDKVSISNKLLSAPSALIATSYGPSANMERVAKAQALGAKQGMAMRARKVMEINPRHPIVVELLRRVSANAEDASAKDIADLMYDTAALHSGFSLDDTSDFAARINRMLKTSLNLDPNAEPTPVEEPMAEPKEPAAKVAKDEL